MRPSGISRSLGVMALMAGLGPAVTAPAVGDGAPGSVAGVVTDSGTGDPIAGASVDVLVGATPDDPDGSFLAIGATAVDGSYLVEDLDPGPASVTVQATGYTSETRFVDIVSMTELGVDFALTAAPVAGITGEVFDSTTTQPIVGANLTLLVGGSCQEPGEFIALATSDAAGLYSIEDVTPGPALLNVQATGYKVYEIELNLVEGNGANLVLVPMVPETSEAESAQCPEDADVGDGAEELPFTGSNTPLLAGLATLLMLTGIGVLDRAQG